MEPQDQLQPKTLLQFTPSELAKHFQSLVKPHGEHVDAINSRLLGLIYKEALPTPVYHIWFNIAVRYSPHLLQAALRDQVSCGVRKAGIKAVARDFHSQHWKDAWDALGGATGLKDIMEDLPLEEVRLLSVAISKCKNMPDLDVSAACIEDLSRLLDETRNKSTQRTMSAQLAPLLDLCSDSFIVRYLSDSPLESVADLQRLRNLARMRPGLLRKIAVGSVAFPLDGRVKIIEEYIEALARAQEPYAPVHLPADILSSNLPSGMVFCLDLVHVGFADSALKTRIQRVLPQHIHETLDVEVRRRVEFDHILVFCEHVVRSYSGGDKSWKGGDNPLFKHIIRYWSVARSRVASIASPCSQHRTHPSAKHTEALESLLIQVIGQIPQPTLDVRKDRTEFDSRVKHPLGEISREARFPFIKLFCRHAKFLDIDLDVWPPSERETHLFPAWDLSLLRSLPAADAELLFKRSLAINDCDEFLPPQEEVPGNGNRISWSEQCVLKAGWESHDANAHNFPLTHKVLGELKQRSERERYADQRLGWIRTAVRVASASMSLDIFHQVVEWTRRFLRDPFVYPSLMRNDLFREDVGGSILSCAHIPLPRQPKSKAALSAAVDKANQILMTYLEIVRLIVREPHYNTYMTRGITFLFGHIINMRVVEAKVYQKTGLASEAELINIILEPLEPIILEYGLLANDEDPEKFTWSGLGGFLPYNIRCPKTSLQYVLPFLDRLAKRRDELWRRKRLDNNPNMASTPIGLPEGLPIQHLLPTQGWTYLSLENPGAAPFVAARVQEVLFAQPDVILETFPPDTELCSTPDSLRFAIRSFIQHPKTKEKRTRVRSIWNHYSKILDSHPGQLVVFRDWLARIADSSWVDPKPRTEQPPPVPLATYLRQRLGPREVLEWDPRNDAIHFQDIKQPEGEISIILLHYRMQAESHSFARYRLPQKLKSITERDPMWIWQLDPGINSDMPLQSREAVVLSAILFLDTLTKGKERILSKSFPQDEEFLRYPSIYLDDQFVGSLGKCIDSAARKATNALKAAVAWVPAQILYDLIRALLDTLSASSEKPANYSTLLTCTFDLIKLLQFTDRPDLAVDIALRVLESFPNESSYHRQLKLSSLGKRLPAQHAELMIQRFATFACDALDKQKQKPRRQEPSTAERDASSNREEGRAYIKITTVKMLAQLLANADFVPQSTCLSILGALFHSGRHIDVRTEVLTAILEMFGREGDSEETYQLFTSLAFSAAGPDERVDVSEHDWLEAEKGAQPLPEISSEDERPLLERFIKAASSTLPERYRADYAQRVVLALLNEWTRQHSRWMKCFLGRIELTPEESSITNFGPFNPVIVDRVFRDWKEYLPADYLIRHRVWVMSYLNFPLLEGIQQKLSLQDREWRQTKAGQHWLDCIKQFRRSDCLSLYHTIVQGIETKIENGITITDVVNEYLHRAAIVIRTPFKFEHKQNCIVISPEQMMAHLRGLRYYRNRLPRSSDSETTYNRLQGLIQRIVADIESLRTDEWLRNPDRQPIVLPSRLELQTILLPSPTYNPASDQPVREFVTQMIPLIRSCAEDPMLLTEFDCITGLAQQVAAQDIPSYALMLGNGPVEEHASLFGALKVQLARSALDRVKEADRLHNAELVEMARKWKGSPNEWARRAGWMLDGSFNG